jgi:MEDS: MEthanogen/methylotroph, DcmR Sensory domain
MKGALSNQPEWSKVSDHAHFVQFYEDEAALVPLLSRYVGSALVAADAAIVVAPESLRERIAGHLAGLGLDVAVARAQDRYLDLDAAASLRHIVRDGAPEAARFIAFAERLIDRAAGVGRRVAVFGSMVDLLCAQGEIEAAIRLEELWNELARRRAFTLACGYRMSRFSNARHAAPFVRICSQHSHVFSAGR